MEVCAQVMVFVKKVIATVCQGGKVRTVLLWCVKTTAVDTVFAVQRKRTNVFVTPAGVELIVAYDYAPTLAPNTDIVTTELVSVDKDGKVLLAKR